MITKNCLQCSKVFIRNPQYSHAQWASSLFCSRSCRGLHSRVKKGPNLEIRQGSYHNCQLCFKEFYAAPWEMKRRQGKKFCSAECRNNGRHFLENYKGADVGYQALHSWVRIWKGHPCKCEHCGIEQSPRGRGIKKNYFEWANKSHEYKRDLNDWLSLCVRCHKKYDRQYRLERTSNVQKDNHGNGSSITMF